MGVMNIKSSVRNGKVVGSIMVDESDEIILITQKGKVIRLHVSQIRTTGRVTQGVRLINLDPDEKVVSIAKIASGHGVDAAAVDGGEREESAEKFPVDVGGTIE